MVERSIRQKAQETCSRHNNSGDHVTMLSYCRRKRMMSAQVVSQPWQIQLVMCEYEHNPSDDREVRWCAVAVGNSKEV